MYAQDCVSTKSLQWIQDRLARFLPLLHEPSVKRTTLPSTLDLEVKILPELKVLGPDEHQSCWVVVEIEGISHNPRARAETSIDLVFLIDNSYASIQRKGRAFVLTAV